MDGLQNARPIRLRDRSAQATMRRMKQLGLGLSLSTKRTRKREFLDELERMVP